jgi:cysteinyl-tRNA synthetase
MLIIDGKEFVPQDPNRVSVYVCGPTVYAAPHLGNLRSAVNFDVLHRVLKCLYREVMFVRNYTDIDDKIMEASERANVPISVITDRSILDYEEATDKLNVLEPTRKPRVTDSLDIIRRFIFDLIDAGFAYEAEGHVLFDREKSPTFFLNENLRPEDLRGDGDASYKRHPHDFVLWKPSVGEQPGWASPWSYGRPGWHIECSALIAEYLGETIDIHAGGIDLKFPHHENECAQSHARHGKPLANYWLHNGMLELDTGKMAKSQGNVITLDEALSKSKASPEALRYLYLTSHYRQPLTFSYERLAAAETSVKSLQRVMRMVGPMMPEYNYVGPLLDDLNTPRAIAELHALSTEIMSNKANDHDIARFISLADAMGLHNNYETRITDEIVSIQIKRSEARSRRDFAEADRLRDVLLEMGVEVNDAPIRRT